MEQTVFECHGGGSIKVNNPSMIGQIAKALSDFEEKSINWHNKLMEQGVKAYRCNDGWVDSEYNVVSFFFDSDRTKGYYWANSDLKIGDKIFIGSEDSGGRFAIIDIIVKVNKYSGHYHYKFID